MDIIIEMGDKLRNYQVLDVLCGGTFYKVRHKVTHNIFAWRAFNCSAFSREQIQNISNEVKTISATTSEHLLRYYDTIFHAPSKTLYLVVEHISWRSLEDVIGVCKDTDKYVAESFVWHLLYELARVCKALEDLRFVLLRKCVTAKSVHVDESGELKVNCFEISVDEETESDLIRQVGDLIHVVCVRTTEPTGKLCDTKYSEDLHDVLSFLRDDRNNNLRPDVVLYHPTVLSNLELMVRKSLSESLLPASTVVSNLCDSEKAVEFCRSDVIESPAYANVSINNAMCLNEGSVSPTIAALALELPGFVPRSRRPIRDACDSPQRVTERTLSQQWMSRLVALREREASLNKRERDIISKEIVNSPRAITFRDNADGITLPTIIPSVKEELKCVSRRRASLRCKKMRKSYADLDSSLSADDGDGSVIITAAKITQENMPRRNIFPVVNARKVHFTSTNPFAESDESVTLTFYDLDDVKGERRAEQPQAAKCEAGTDISEFKYMDLERVPREKRAALPQWSHSSSSPSKQARSGCSQKKPLIDITNCKSAASRKDRCSMAPLVAHDAKKSKGRKSLLSFKTPFKFIASNKV